jgi:hypothetical protein
LDACRTTFVTRSRFRALALLLGAVPVAQAGTLGRGALPPVDYVIEKTKQHPIVLVGEGHWIRHDAMLVAELVPRLAEQRVVLAMETLRASDQSALERVLSGREWDEAAAIGLLRSAAWPWQEYLDILRAAWKARSMRVVALAPNPDWRETLLRAKGTSYDAFMAERIAAEVAAGRRVLVYCGIHHAYTRYYQPELDLAGRARSFFDRTGNILRRRFGENVFLITLHRPVWCGKEPWDYCLPLGGAIDCAALAGGAAVGFDVAGSDLAGQVLDPGLYYAHGYPELRFGETTDGYVWTRPIEEYELVRLIPLSAFAPDGAALREVDRNNPFSDEKGLTRERLEKLWSDEERSRTDALAYRKWQGLADWRKACRSE